MSKKTTKWWRNLSNQQRSEYIDRKVQQKAIRRILKGEKDSAKIKELLGPNKTCKSCFHLKTKSCDGLSSLDKVCIDYFNPK